jgi:uncharacterized protein
VNPKYKTWQWARHHRAKQLFSIMRWLHVYLSTALFSLLFFFCITGLFLNHLSWFDSNGKKDVVTINLTDNIAQQLRNTKNLPLDQLETFVMQKTTLRDPRAIDIDRELGEITLDYPLPAGYAFVTVFLDDAVVEVEYQQGTLIALLNDLHKGRHTGSVWSWVIDISAVLIALFSVSGMVILLQMPRFRSGGLLLAACGALTPWLLYLIFVPQYP